MLREGFTEPRGVSVASVESRLVDMFTSGTHPEVKEVILKSFQSQIAPLRIVIDTIAFGMGIDCPDVQEIIHVGPPSDVEDFVQQIGRAGRDNLPSFAMLKYCRLVNLCRRNFLFSEFDSYSPSYNRGCFQLYVPASIVLLINYFIFIIIVIIIITLDLTLTLTKPVL